MPSHRNDAGRGLQLERDPVDAPPRAGAARGRRCAPRAPLALLSLTALLTLGGVASAESLPADAPATDQDGGARADLRPLEPALWPADPFGDRTRARRFGHHRDRAREAVRAMIEAGDRIATRPYVYGGGHGSFDAAGYDCSGSVSYVLHAAGLLATPEDSSALMSYGEPGPGRYVTVYANPEHAFMTIRGRRFDTIAFQEGGSRWSSTASSAAGYTVRHPRGM